MRIFFGFNANVFLLFLKESKIVFVNQRKNESFCFSLFFCNIISAEILYSCKGFTFYVNFDVCNGTKSWLIGTY